MSNEPLVSVKTTSLLLVEPIWERPIDDIEGPLYQQYIQRNPGYTDVLVRKSIADMLHAAAELLPSQHRLVLRAGHRPIEVQLRLLEMVKTDYLEKTPGATNTVALEFARTFVSDPAIKLPPHCCGAAVDVDVLDKSTGELVDFGCPMNTDDEIAFLDTGKINDTQQENRDMLLAAMTKAGFAPFQYEWWHFSYGDQTWADYYDKRTELYNIIEPQVRYN